MAIEQSSSTTQVRKLSRRSVKRAAVFTTGEISQICSVAPRTVSKWIDSGELTGYRIPGAGGKGSDRRVTSTNLENFLIKHGMEERVVVVRRAVAGENILAVMEDVQKAMGHDPAFEVLARTVEKTSKAKQSPDDRGFVYFFRLSSTGPIKIGFSLDPAERLKTVLQGMPKKAKLRSLGAMFGGRPHELSLHREFARLRLGGEWFRPDPGLLAYIAENAIPLELLGSSEGIPIEDESASE